MQRLIAIALLSLGVAGGAVAADDKNSPSPQQERMQRCSQEATERLIGGGERKAFMSDCLRGDKRAEREADRAERKEAREAERAERKAEREEAKAERKAEREEAKAERKAEREEAKAERKARRQAEKEERKANRGRD